MTDQGEQIGLAKKFRRGSYGVVCDRGLNPRRPVNEDSFLVIEDACLFAVADGVGGQNAGEVASQTAMEILRHYFSKKVRGDKARYLEQIVAHINSYLYELSIQEEGLSGMATTLALLLLEPRSALLCHVGDSRVYRFTSGRLYRETIDHSLAEYEHHGGLSILEYAKRNIITRAIGVEAEVKPDFKKISLEPNTSFLLCTDGITRHVSDQELEDILEEESDPQIVCDRLKEICYERGARDNLAAIMVRLEHLSHRGRALMESEQAESGAEGSLLKERTTPLMRIQVPLLSESGTRTAQPPMSSEGEGEASEARARVGPQPESAAFRSISVKSLPALTMAVISALAIFVAGLIIGKRDRPPRLLPSVLQARRLTLTSIKASGISAGELIRRLRTISLKRWTLTGRTTFIITG